jgi:hypothetical protein
MVSGTEAPEPVTAQARRFTGKWARRAAVSLAVAGRLLAGCVAGAAPRVLSPDNFRHYAETFNQNDEELTTNAIPNREAWNWMKGNIPWFECSDSDIEEIYYFRWWTYRKHIKKTPDGYIITEFLPPVPWAGKYNSINCAASHHIYEGRWLRDRQILDQYILFWLRGGGNPRLYSTWLADAIYQRFLVIRDMAFITGLLPDLVANYHGWEKERFDAETGLFWQEDGKDGMEVSIGGSGYRATINSYMYGDAVAIADIARLAENEAVAKEFDQKAARLKETILSKLWDPQVEFFKVLPRGKDARMASVRELHGYTPWYFNIPDERHVAAWRQISDPQGFLATYGPTTAEQRSPKFAVSYQGHECQWNGPSWPYATSVTLTAMANVLNGPPQSVVDKRTFFDALKTYAKSQHRKLENGKVVPWIDENLNPNTGDWLSRTRLSAWSNGTWAADKGGVERGKDYNHSTFNDLVITGLVGVRPNGGHSVDINPLVPANALDYFCLDGLDYRGQPLTVIWDKTGERYHKGKGLSVWRDGGTKVLRAMELGNLHE